MITVFALKVVPSKVDMIEFGIVNGCIPHCKADGT
jgi:hypothetical protein